MKKYQDHLPTQPDTVLMETVAHELQTVPFDTNMMCYKTVSFSPFSRLSCLALLSQAPAYELNTSQTLI